jgi:hypothetical protein
LFSEQTARAAEDCAQRILEYPTRAHIAATLKLEVFTRMILVANALCTATGEILLEWHGQDAHRWLLYILDPDLFGVPPEAHSHFAPERVHLSLSRLPNSPV